MQALRTLAPHHDSTTAHARRHRAARPAAPCCRLHRQALQLRLDSPRLALRRRRPRRLPSRPPRSPAPRRPATTALEPAARSEPVLSEGRASDGLEPLASTAGLRRARHPDGRLQAGIACAWGRPNTDLVLTVVQVGVAPAEEATWSQALDASGYVLTDAPSRGALQRPSGCGERHHAGRPAGAATVLTSRQLAGLRRTDRAGGSSRASCPRRPATPSDRGAAASAARSGCRGGPRGSARTGPPGAR